MKALEQFMSLVFCGQAQNIINTCSSDTSNSSQILQKYTLIRILSFFICILSHSLHRGFASFQLSEPLKKDRKGNRFMCVIHFGS